LRVGAGLAVELVEQADVDKHGFDQGDSQDLVRTVQLGLSTSATIVVTS
jgi:hypothetical protein